MPASRLEGERHTLKVGGDFRVNAIRERFRFAEPDELPDVDLDFQDQKEEHGSGRLHPGPS